MRDHEAVLSHLAALEQSARPRAGYTGGELTRLNQQWRPRNRTADLEIRKNWELLLARSRWLGRNNPWCVGARRTLVDNVVGEGIRTRATARGRDGELLKDWNRAADELYLRWMNEADVTGQQHWLDVTRTGLNQCIEDGEILLVECADPDPRRVVPLCYQLVEVDQLDRTRDRPRGDNQNEIRRGIEFDAGGRPVAYWLFTEHPGAMHHHTFGSYFRSERVPAARVIHLFRRERATQTRGVSWFAPIVTTLWNAYEYMSHEIDAAKVASFFVYLWKREHGEGGLGFADENSETAPTDEFGNVQAPLGPGIGMEGGPEDDLEVIQSNRPNSQATPWLKFLLQMMGTGVGLSFVRFTGDFSETNFSASRAADLQDRKHFRPLQDWHAWHVDLRVRKRFTEQAIALGELDVPAGGVLAFERNPSRWLACKARPPGWGYVDPPKQVKASMDAIAGGLSTWDRELAMLGLDREDVFDSLAEELPTARALGLQIGSRGSSTGSGTDQDDEEAQRNAQAA